MQTLRRSNINKRQEQVTRSYYTVRKISDRISVERTFPIFSPNIESIELNKTGRVRRAKLYYLRERSGKSARIKEKRMNTAATAAKAAKKTAKAAAAAR